ncbi:hypothetical protein [Novosphingobium marinum]|uniref:hypothetical protein n=1 Tax=Novosphingobium marinum TaxID=1514948 RepID=UPI0035716003
MFYPLRRVGARRAAVSQIADESGIVSGKAAEFGPGHSGIPQKALDPANQHGLSFVFA